MRYHSINLRIVPADDATLGVTDLGLRRGFAAFDYLRLVGGVPLFLDDHLARFERSAERLGLQPPAPRGELAAHLRELVARNGAREAGVQLFLTGGYADDGFTPATPNLLMLLTPLPARPPELYRDGATLLLERFRRELPDIKSTNYLNAVRLIPAMRAAGAADVLYHDGVRALETSRCNLFLVQADGRLLTPGRDVLAGVTRRNLLAAVADELEVDERDVPLEELGRAREAFVTSTTKGALPVVRIGDTVIGDGRPGPVTARARELFAAHLERYLAGAR